MCDWCQQHGEDKKWYLNVKNFSKDFSKDKAMVEAPNAYFQNIESFVGTSPPMNVEIFNLKNDDQFSETARTKKQLFNTLMHARNSGRSITCWIGIVPLQALDKILGGHVHD
jgi:hypothetical protein